MNKYENAIYLIGCHTFRGLDKNKLIIEPLQELVERATPPTKEEVCKALSEYYGKKHNEDFEVKLIDNQFIAKGYHWTFYLSDQDIGSFMLDRRYDLITLIGRFYEGVIDNE